MITKLYSIKDTKADMGLPFAQMNDHVAMRTFKTLVNDEKQELSKYPEDLELYKIGSYDTATGQLTSEIKYLCRGTDVKEINNVPR